MPDPPVIPHARVVEIVEAAIARLGLPAALVGTTPGGHDTAYTEVLVSFTDCTEDPCHLVVGVRRDSSEPQIVDVVEDTLRSHVHGHPHA